MVSNNYEPIRLTECQTVASWPRDRSWFKHSIFCHKRQNPARPNFIPVEIMKQRNEIHIFVDNVVSNIGVLRRGNKASAEFCRKKARENNVQFLLFFPVTVYYTILDRSEADK